MNTLNDRQIEAVEHTEGPLLLLAGAGSGKTRVITHRIAYLIEEKNINPWTIMAITFTNKAAAEMRERVDNIVGYGSEHVWVSTFHSTCVKILRKYINRLGYDNNFTIFDSDDSKTVMKDVCKRLNIDTKQLKEKAILYEISKAKNEMISPEAYREKNNDDFKKVQYISAYFEYQDQLKKNNALDFDDLLVKAVELFRENPDVLETYQNRFKYIMVDEYQDTNTVQFMFIKLLAEKYRNLCVVGDDDQSIYKFRGANIYNILNFEKYFPDTKVIKLEQNYRSSANILNAANSVISNNVGRKAKKLWTEKEPGAKIRRWEFQTAYEEAEGIAKDIVKSLQDGYTYSSSACLYRTNAQSRLIEEKLIGLNIPYKLVGGVNFYQRKEIKDMLAYLRTVNNGNEDLAVKRIINVPKRGIGATSIDRLQQYADMYGTSFLEACEQANNLLSGRAAEKVSNFYSLIRRFKLSASNCSIKELLDMIITETEYVEELKKENTDEADDRIENIAELVNKVVDYEDNADEPSLSELLEEISLIADIDGLDENADYVVLMTIHSAKGLEFPRVYICGMEENLFPGYAVIEEHDDEELEEERRLCYVAITRAMKELTITYAKSRMIRGETQYNRHSRFVDEIPDELFEETVKSMSFMDKFNAARSTINNNSNYNDSSYNFNSKPYELKKVSEQKKPEGLPYGIGDTVKHIKFGMGEVIAIADAGRDYEITVNFQNYGIKKLMSNFAKLQRIS